MLVRVRVWSASAEIDNFAQAFQNPPEAARPWVYWYWMQGAVSREGITADLEAMKRAGIAGAYLMPIKDVPNPPLFNPPARQLSPEWWAMIRHSFAEADRLDLKIAMHDCDGFATAGGPWITPELAMQRVVWSEQEIEGGRRFEGPLQQPASKEGFYRDIAILAFPTPEGTGVTTHTVVPKVTTSVPGISAQDLAGKGVRLRSDNPCWILYEFAKPFTCRSITIRPGGGNYQANRLIVEISDDGVSFRSLGRLEAPRHGWQDTDADATHAIVPTTARFFRFVYDKEGTEAGSEDLDSAKFKNRLLVEQIELSSAPRIPHYEGKTGVVWRKSNRATGEQLPDALCVPLKKIIDLTSRCEPDGHLAWDAPPGRWTILRIGYTPTGHRNETGGGGKGLECDKFNPEAARVQFNGWFAETIRQVGPKLADRVLKVFHVDSWEAGSQNWSPVFRAEFQKRRGYDPTLYLPAFAGIPIGTADISERFLYDVRRTIDELTADAFFGTMAKLAHEHGCVFSSESVAPTMTGDGMRHFGEVDVPMGEFWLRSPTHDKPNDIQDAVSGAHVYGKPIVRAEAFTELRMQWDEHPGMLKTLGDHNFCLGINSLVLHVFAHNPWMDRRPGMTLDGVGVYFQRDQTWWDDVGGWFSYLTRCEAVLQQGRPVADVLYFTGEELPSRSLIPERYTPPLPPGYKADSINRDALLRLATVSNGRIVLPGGASYGLLVLPDTPLMTCELAAKIRDLVKHGAIIYGPPPERSLSLEKFPKCDEQLRHIAAEVWGEGRRVKGFDRTFGKGRVIGGASLESVLNSIHAAPDVLVSANGKSSAPKIEWTHRTLANEDIYFISNQADEEQHIDVSVRSSDKGPQMFDPVTGTVGSASFTRDGDRTKLPLRLPANGSIFIALRQTAPPPQPFTGVKQRETRPLLQLVGPWQVAFDPKLGGPDRPVMFSSLESWTTRTEPGIRYYSGAAVYEKTFHWDLPTPAGRVYIDLGKPADITQITLNSQDCGVAWTAPYRVDISRALRPGVNSLKIRVANTWANRLIGDHALPESERITWTIAPYRLDQTQLRPAGLLGPVSLVIELSAALSQ